MAALIPSRLPVVRKADRRKAATGEFITIAALRLCALVAAFAVLAWNQKTARSFFCEVNGT
ncbi:MAG: hypothetical protein U0Z53_23100 [Blastocatellia bacterium]